MLYLEFHIFFYVVIVYLGDALVLVIAIAAVLVVVKRLYIVYAQAPAIVCFILFCVFSKFLSFGRLLVGRFGGLLGHGCGQRHHHLHWLMSYDIQYEFVVAMAYRTTRNNPSEVIPSVTQGRCSARRSLGI